MRRSLLLWWWCLAALVMTVSATRRGLSKPRRPSKNVAKASKPGKENLKSKWGGTSRKYDIDKVLKKYGVDVAKYDHPQPKSGEDQHEAPHRHRHRHGHHGDEKLPYAKSEEKSRGQWGGERDATDEYDDDEYDDEDEDDEGYYDEPHAPRLGHGAQDNVPPPPPSLAFQQRPPPPPRDMTRGRDDARRLRLLMRIEAERSLFERSQRRRVALIRQLARAESPAEAWRHMDKSEWYKEQSLGQHVFEKPTEEGGDSVPEWGTEDDAAAMAVYSDVVLRHELLVQGFSAASTLPVKDKDLFGSHAGRVCSTLLELERKRLQKEERDVYYKSASAAGGRAGQVAAEQVSKELDEERAWRLQREKQEKVYHDAFVKEAEEREARAQEAGDRRGIGGGGGGGGAGQGDGDGRGARGQVEVIDDDMATQWIDPQVMEPWHRRRTHMAKWSFGGTWNSGKWTYKVQDVHGAEAKEGANAEEGANGEQLAADGDGMALGGIVPLRPVIVPHVTSVKALRALFEHKWVMFVGDRGVMEMFRRLIARIQAAGKKAGEGMLVLEETREPTGLFGDQDILLAWNHLKQQPTLFSFRYVGSAVTHQRKYEWVLRKPLEPLKWDADKQSWHFRAKDSLALQHRLVRHLMEHESSWPDITLVGTGEWHLLMDGPEVSEEQWHDSVRSMIGKFAKRVTDQAVSVQLWFRTLSFVDEFRRVKGQSGRVVTNEMILRANLNAYDALGKNAAFSRLQYLPADLLSNDRAAKARIKASNGIADSSLQIDLLTDVWMDGLA